MLRRLSSLARCALVAATLAPLAWTGVVHAQTRPDDVPPAPSATTTSTAAPPPPAPTTTTAPTTTSIPAPPPPATGDRLTPPPPATSTSPSTNGAAGVVSAINPTGDLQDLQRQGNQRPNGEVPAKPGEVFSDDWWGRARPIFEIHGYFRTRSELFHNFSLGRHNAPGDTQNFWGQPLDQTYKDSAGTDHPVTLCGPNADQRCQDKTEATANMRFRMNPELHISDNLRIMTQIDALDNVVLGSTPDAYTMKPGLPPTATGLNNSALNGSGYSSNGFNGYAPFGAFSTTQGPPTAGVNSYTNSIAVKRAWAEYTSPVGQIRFGRMPSQWGLGMLANSGDGIDSDYQTTTDRIMFITGIKSADLYFGGAWDFVSTGPTTAQPWDVYGGQAYNTCNLCNVNEWVMFAAHRTNPELQKRMLNGGDVVLNGGVYAIYRSQLLDVKAGDTPLTVNSAPPAVNNGLEFRGAEAFIPDVWLQVMWKKFRFEGEFATIFGDIANTKQTIDVSDPIKIRQYGLVTQTEYRAVEDKLRLDFGFGWASGDPWAAVGNSGQLNPGSSGLTPEGNSGRGPISTFRFNPDYRVDLIFFRHILSRVEGAYYFRPSVDYDFIRNVNGQKFGGGAAIIWSRASEFIQTPGHKRDLGVELDVNVYYQAKDGSLNDDPDKIGGFYTMLQYGVFFPMGGLSYLPGEQTSSLPDWGTSTAHTVRLLLGVVY